MWYVQQRQNKYGAKKTVWNGRQYDSKHEATVAQEISFLRRAGEVVKEEPQTTFGLYGKNGTKVCSHRVDFLLTFKDGHQEVWEAKSPATMTPSWHIKRKLFEDNYPDIKYVVVTSRGTWFARQRNGKHAA